MKFIADVNVEKSIVDELRNMSYDVMWIVELNRSECKRKNKSSS